MTKIRILALLLSLTLPANSQHQNYNVYGISVDQGLPTNDIQYLYHDSYGFLWIGTYEGIFRWDGYTFKTYRHNEKDSASINHNIVYTIFEDSEKNLWVGTIEGINLYNRSKDNFIRCTIGKPGQKIPVNAIREDSKHRLWLGTSIGLCRYDFKNKNGTWFFEDVQNTIFCLDIDRNDDIWLGTFNAGVKKFSQATSKFSLIDKSSNATLTSNIIKSILCDQQDQVWIGTNNGITLVDLNGRTKKTFLTETNEGMQRQLINCIFQDDQQRIWIGVGRGSLMFVDNNTLTPMKQSVLNSSRYSLNSVGTICQDSFGNTWFGTAGNGMFYTNKHKNVFENRFQESQTDVVTTIMQDKSEGIWLGTENAGLIQIVNGSINRYNAKANGLSNDAITDIREGANGDLWITTWNGGLMKFNYRTKNITTFKHDPNNNSIPINDAKSLAIADTVLWIGTHGEGLVAMDLRTGHFTDHRNNTGYKFQMDRPGWINHLFLDSQQRLWISSYSGVFVLKSGTLTQYLHEADSSTISSNSVNMISEDLQGNIWVISDAGLDQFIEETKSFARLTDNYSLPENIKSLVVARSGKLWMGTSEGIVSLDPTTKKVDRYDARDGLQGNAFFHKAIMEGKDGCLYFGGPRGLNVFHPDSLKPVTVTSHFHTTDLSIYNQPSQQNRAKGPGVQTLDAVDKLTLSHDQSFFSIEVAAINLYAPGRTQYAYKLDNQHDWIKLGSDRKISFTDLAPGNYTLSFQYTEPDGIWKDAVKNIEITILPPWYQTTLFKFALLFLLATIIVAIFYLRVSGIKRRNRLLTKEVAIRTRELSIANDYLLERSEEIRSQNERLEDFNHEVLRQSEKILEQQRHITEQNRELEHSVTELQKLNKTKDHFFSILAHDLKNPVSALTGISDYMKTNFLRLEKKEALQYLTSIHNSSNAIYELLINLLNWSRAQSKIIEYRPIDFNMYELARKNIALLETQFSSKHISVTNEVPSDTTIYGDYNMIDTVIRNILSNSVKFTEYNGKVSISAQTLGEQVMIAVKDSGVGMSKEQLQKLFDLDKNNISTGTAGEKGTGLGLVICAEFISVNMGSIDVESESGKGTSFIIKLPRSIATVEAKLKPVRNEQPHKEPNFWETVSFDKLLKLKGKKILIVDDNTELRTYLRLLLADTFEIFEASDGEEGLKLALEVQPAAIVSDLIMPKINGLDLCRQLKANAVTCHIPVVLLTSQWEDTIQISGYEAGADIYLTKPVKKELFIQVILNFISKQEKLRDKIILDFSINTPLEFAEPGINKLDEEFLISLIGVVERNISDTNLDTRLICDEIAISRSVLYAKIKSLTGQTVHEFIKAIRLKRAVFLLREGRHSISQISSEVGFASHSYFDKCFAKQYGAGPGEYLKQHNLRVG
jgi:ligand-binding sensor domain-containing protein/DNA-binding NarL/FixJ family response regulator/nitrogen-specific signal transduction histidine kinase